jgi:hypothetical protein
MPPDSSLIEGYLSRSVSWSFRSGFMCAASIFISCGERTEWSVLGGFGDCGDCDRLVGRSGRLCEGLRSGRRCCLDGWTPIMLAF